MCMASLLKLVRQFEATFMLTCGWEFATYDYDSALEGFYHAMTTNGVSDGLFCYAFLLALPGCHCFLTGHRDQVAVFCQLLRLTELDNFATYALSLLES